MDSQATNITYDIHNNKYFAVKADRDLYEKQIREIKGTRWSKRVEGWLVLRDKKDQLDTFIRDANLDNRLKDIKQRGKSRKEQKKYRRAVSGDEYSDDEVREKIPLSKQRKATPVAKETLGSSGEDDDSQDIDNMSLNKVFSAKTSPKVLNFYKQFGKSPDIPTPDSYRSEEDDLSISSESSTAFLPSPTHKRRTQRYEERDRSTERERRRDRSTQRGRERQRRNEDDKYYGRRKRSPSPDIREITREMRKMQEKLYKMERRIRK
jgi:hypothetical protein